MREIKFRYWTWAEMASWWLCDTYAEENINGDWKLMQYTWLKDKNWKEIYEGDIVRYRAFTQDGELEKMVKWVFFDEDFGCFMLWEDECMWNLATDDNKDIVWNIYENPELLK